MMNLLAMPLRWITALFLLAFPMLSGPGRATSGASTSAIGSTGTWMARLVLVTLTLLGLGAINRSETLGLMRWIPYGRLGEFWLPLFAFCSYALIWLAWLLYRVLNTEIGPETPEYPDIDRAWELALEALGRADIPLHATPLYLVIGWNASEEETLFHAAGFKAQVKQVPRDPGEPLHVTANRDAIWLTCPGVSLMTQQGSAGQGDEARVGGAGAMLTGMGDTLGDPFKTAGLGAGETLRVEDFIDSLNKARAQARDRTVPKVRSASEVERFAARLRYLCRLIARDRQGFCPINGVLVVLPITAADPGSNLDEVAGACRTDLTVAFETFGIRCPLIVLISDLERLDGFAELVERLPSGQLSKRMGQRFPLAVDINPGEVPSRVEESVAWIGGTLFPSMVSSLYQVEVAGGDDVSEAIRANTQLYRFISRMHERRDRLARLVRDCLPNLSGEPVLYGGCYFAGTGDDSGTEQAFSPGVYMRLIQEQDSVTWTEELIARDTAHLRLARALRTFLIGYIILAVLATFAWIGWKKLPGWAGADPGNEP